jgi:hypothetical protein
MKYLLLILLVLFCIDAGAQQVTGIVIDKNTRKPVEYVIVTASNTSTMTSDLGSFTLKITKVIDTIRIQTMGYKTYTRPVSPWSGRLKLIELEPQSIRLGEVAITAKRNYLRDSTNNRKQFAKEFAFRGPRLTDVMRPTATNVPFAWVSVDLLSLFRAIGKKKSPQYRLQQTMLRYEREDHTNQRFTHKLVGGLTGLQGDTLDDFMNEYRPTTPAQVDAMTDYNLVLYIKDSLQRFKTKTANAKITKPDFKVDTTSLD